MLESTTPLDSPDAGHRGQLGDFALIASLCLVLFLAGNGRVSLWDRDEAWYAETAREMWTSGDYIVPRFNAEPRFRKPVLIYWLMAGAYSVFGDNEFGARFFSGVAGTVTCLLTYRLGTRMGGRAMGLAAGLMLAVCPMMLVESRMATTDATLTAALTGAMLCLWELHAAGPSRRWSLGFWFLIGVAMLTKGPIGPGLVALAVAVWCLLSRQILVLRRLNWIAGVPLALCVVIPWGVAIYVVTNGEFFRYVIHHEALAHSLGVMEHHSGFPGFYLVIAGLGLFPWSLALGIALAGAWRWARQNGPELFLVGWIVGPLVVLELMRSKLPHYCLPTVPAWSLLIARGLVEFRAAGKWLTQSTRGWIRLATFVLPGTTASTVLAWLALNWAPEPVRVPLLAVAGVMFGGGVVAVLCCIARRDLWAWSAMVCTSWCVGLLAAGWVLPRADGVRVAHAAAEALQGKATATETPIALFGFREPSLVFYIGEPVPSFNSLKQLNAFLDEHPAFVTLLREPDVKRLKEYTNVQVELCERIDAQPIRGIMAESAYVARITSAGTQSEIEAARVAPVDPEQPERPAETDRSTIPLER